MKSKSYNWLSRLIDKITKTDCPNNDHFYYYGREVTLQSGTLDYVDAFIIDGNSQINFTFDFYTKELCFDSYESFEQRNVIMQAFRRLYNSLRIEVDAPWEDEIKSIRKLLGNDEYDQESLQQEYNELLRQEAA